MFEDAGDDSEDKAESSPAISSSGAIPPESLFLRVQFPDRALRHPLSH